MQFVLRFARGRGRSLCVRIALFGRQDVPLLKVRRTSDILAHRAENGHGNDGTIYRFGRALTGEFVVGGVRRG